MLPTEFEPLLDELASAPASVRAVWRYAIVLLMVDDEKARVVNSIEEQGKTMRCVRTNSGDEFWIARPEMSDDLETVLLAQIRQITDDDIDE